MKSANPPLLRVPAPRSRVIVVGDIHGCYYELEELLRRIEVRDSDLVVSSGDIVRKGPHPDRCLELWRERGFLAVLGNNDEKALGQLRQELAAYVRAWPLVIDVADLAVAVVHGGLFPGTRIEREDVERMREDVVRLRWIRLVNGTWRRVGKTRQRPEDVLWAEVWDGPQTVLYGHTPLREPRIDRKAIGLDTGCVYGGSLTAAILEGGAWRFERVPARQQYAA